MSERKLLQLMYFLFICRLGIRTCLLLVPLLGFTWLFGLLSPFHKAFAYIFTIFNTTQVILNHSSLFRSSIVNTRKWLGNLAKFFVVYFCLLFGGLTLHKTWQNTINKHTQKMCKQEQLPSNINLSLFDFY